MKNERIKRQREEHKIKFFDALKTKEKASNLSVNSSKFY